MKLICPPPTSLNLVFQCSSHTFTWSAEEESFDAWAEKIANYGKDNRLPEDQWSLNAILGSLSSQLGGQSSQFIQKDEPSPGIDLSLKASSVVPPQSLVLATKLAFPTKPVLAVASGVLTNLSASQWVTVIRVWKDQNPNATREEAGRVWWFILHTLAANCENETDDVGTWLNLWHNRFPCKACVDHFRSCPVVRPTDWSDLPRFASEAHDWVTANK